MAELNFCPYCDAPQHKLLLCRPQLFFCKVCNRFFKFDDVNMNCTRCKGNLQKSDFDSPSGGAVFFCTKCKKTYSVAELFDEEKEEVLPTKSEKAETPKKKPAGKK